MAEQSLHLSHDIVRSGSCLCGHVKYQLTGEPSNASLCHCLNCKKTSGSAFWCTGWFSKKQMTLTASSPSDLKTYEDRDTESGSPLWRKFCSNCGSTLFAESPRTDDFIVVALGSLDKDQKPWNTTIEVYAKDDYGWVPQKEGVKVFQGKIERI
ncbi:hypothetical protein D8B26_002463 [Coccidioides posadasii str. Silveira]|uniref:DUF636 domain-containing protein n=1 Tax=Coccidioides posadasii RMSCC 3488 TaxID=454284 RepID=A0A0J6F9F5_COCPO|nr:DUF636 domain-containing protein [Coccidioides posadasii RMSCC 3488]QVM07772.1 hypothetical protein D8B26_002463 [Coccidioides posadasii str. Silveira]